MTTPDPVVLVHGNPETAGVWIPLLAALGTADAFCLSPPGFGAPLPSSFSATPQGYRDWLVGRLERFDGPVHLVGHDWGGAHVLAVAMARPDLLRSWVSDAAGLFDPAYVWHDLARTWQQPGAGERWVTAFETPLGERMAAMAALGIAEPVAGRLAAGQDAEMGRAVLELYRAAAQPEMADAGRELEAAAASPGLVLDPTADDLTGTSLMRQRQARRAGARVAVLEGVGHWWMVQAPDRAAAVLRSFWDDLR